MNNIKNRDFFLVYFIIFISMLVFAFWPHIFYSEDISTISIHSTDFSNGQNDLSYRLKQPSEPIVETYSALVKKESLENLDADNYWMVIKRLDAQGYKVWWNDELIGEYGDVINGNANIWNGSEIFRISSSNIKENNEIKIMMHCKYDIGIADDSIQISDEKTIKRIDKIYKFFSCYLTYVSIGIAFFSIILSAMLMILYKYNRMNVIYLMCAMISIIIYSVS